MKHSSTDHGSNLSSATTTFWRSAGKPGGSCQMNHQIQAGGFLPSSPIPTNFSFQNGCLFRIP